MVSAVGRHLVSSLFIVVLLLLGSACQLGPKPPPASGEEASDRRTQPAPRAQRPRRLARPRIPRCPPKAINCKRAGGRVLYVEAVDPDGDGDAHVVLASRQGITLPGVTIVDIPIRLRPARLPRRGDWVTASGPVFPGSRGQSQIEARKLRVRRAGR